MGKEAYARGFAKAAMDRGCDPVGLAKMAGTPLEEGLLSIPGNAYMGLHPALAPVAPVLNTATYLGGLLSPEKAVSSTSMNLVPGVTGFNWGNRIKSQVKRELKDIAKDKGHEGAKPVAHAVAEHLGQITSIAGTAGLGALLGALAGKTDRTRGAIAGGLAGLGAGTGMQLIGALAAAIRRRRTKEEQIESDKGSVLKKYLIPGTAVYDYYKRVGRSQGDMEESAKSRKSKTPKEGDRPDNVKKASFDWGVVKKWLEDAKAWYSSQDVGTRALIGAGGGALAGAGLASLAGGSKATGALLGGAVGGVAGTMDWNRILAGGKPREMPKEMPKGDDWKSKYPKTLVKSYEAAIRRELERRSDNAKKYYESHERRLPLPLIHF